MKKTPLEIAREYFPNESNEVLEAVIWEETGFPTFFAPKEGQTIEDCFRGQLVDARLRYEKREDRLREGVDYATEKNWRERYGMYEEVSDE